MKIGIGVISENPNIPWNWKYISNNPNITIEFVLVNPNKLWNLGWNGISQNPNIMNYLFNKKLKHIIINILD